MRLCEVVLLRDIGPAASESAGLSSVRQVQVKTTRDTGQNAPEQIRSRVRVHKAKVTLILGREQPSFWRL